MIEVWDKRVAEWVAQRIPGCGSGFGNCQALGVIHKGRLIAGVVFHNWNPEAQIIEVSGAADDPRWFTRSVINTALGYVFDRLGCQMLIARQRLDNDRAREPWLAIGGEERAIPRLYGREIDGSIITLTEEAWRQSKFCKESGHGRKKLGTGTA